MYLVQVDGAISGGVHKPRPHRQCDYGAHVVAAIPRNLEDAVQIAVRLTQVLKPGLELLSVGALIELVSTLSN
jgi:hypothetical protein